MDRLLAETLPATVVVSPHGMGSTGPGPGVASGRGVVHVSTVTLRLFTPELAVGAVGHALAMGVRRRRYDVAVLRALGMSRWQSRGVVVTQATVLAGVGLLFGVPVGLALGRTLWRVVADSTPLLYVPPVTLWALLLIVPLALLIANLLAGPPGQRCCRSTRSCGQSSEVITAEVGCALVFRWDPRPSVE